MKPRLLDLFCGAGGAAMGYSRAGFRVIGADIRPQPNYPFGFMQVDWREALDFALDGDRIDAIHASPPCQAYTDLRHRTRGEYPDLIAETRRLLQATGLPYVIENVVGAPLTRSVVLCGSSFGLGANGRQLRRHRIFECSFPILAPPCQHWGQPVGVYGTGGGGQMTRGYKAAGVAEAREALGTPWMTLAECAQAIPPAYCEHIGGYLLSAIRRVAA